MPATFTISHTMDHAIIEDLEVEFDDFRTRIARLSMSACDVVSEFYQPLGPVDEEIIDLKIVEPDFTEFTIDLEALEAAAAAAQARVTAAAAARFSDTAIYEFAA